jgi:hypothetical protein
MLGSCKLLGGVLDLKFSINSQDFIKIECILREHGSCLLEMGSFLVATLMTIFSK